MQEVGKSTLSCNQTLSKALPPPPGVRLLSKRSISSLIPPSYLRHALWYANYVLFMWLFYRFRHASGLNSFFRQLRLRIYGRKPRPLLHRSDDEVEVHLRYEKNSTAISSGIQPRERSNGLLNRQTKHSSTLNSTYMPCDRRRRMLSLDGAGGLRGLSSLATLKRLMESIDPENPPRPCEVFDVIHGAGENILLSMMLARIGMSVDDCSAAYNRLLESAFKGESKAGLWTWDLEAFENCVVQIIAKHGLPEKSLYSEHQRFAGFHNICKKYV
jgi:hypothetical protein